MADLWLSVKQEYFDAYKTGNKPEEYRLCNEYWEKRLVGRDYTWLHYRAGYPNKEQQSQRMVSMPYKGYEIKTITHKHFGPEPVQVFAIKLASLPTQDGK